MNLNSILQVLCPPRGQFLLWVPFWAQFMQHRGCSSGCAGHEGHTPPGGRWLPGEVSCWRTARLAQLCAGDTPTPTLQCRSLIFDNISPHLKQEISCALKRTQADSAVDRPAPDARKGQSHTVTAAWCCAAGLAMV